MQVVCFRCISYNDYDHHMSLLQSGTMRATSCALLYPLSYAATSVDIVYFLSLLHLFDFLADRGEFCRGGGNVGRLIEEM